MVSCYIDSPDHCTRPGRHLKSRIHTRIDEIPADQWNALVHDGNPLVRHEFLAALEHHDCVGSHFGWLPRHVALYDGDTLRGAMVLYEKHNNYGEFVFDHAWAAAWQQAGLSYYPKLVSAIPYTPATGQRMLCAPGDEAAIYPQLLQAALELAEKLGASSIHCLFADQAQLQFLESQKLPVRVDCNYHWHNRDYRDFDDFLAALTAKKRKNIRQERRRVTDAGVTIRQLDGHTATAEDWTHFARFYAQTFDEKWGVATFNEAFFCEVAQMLPDRVLLVLADQGGETVAGALMYRSDTTLFGRHWGSDRRIDGLHFEACYYRGIEYCIEHGLATFEPGVQGEHKIARGFEPTLTRSAHWVAESGFRAPVADFVQRERAAIEGYARGLQNSSPFKEPNHETTKP